MTIEQEILEALRDLSAEKQPEVLRHAMLLCDRFSNPARQRVSWRLSIALSNN